MREIDRFGFGSNAILIGYTGKSWSNTFEDNSSPRAMFGVCVKEYAQ